MKITDRAVEYFNSQFDDEVNGIIIVLLLFYYLSIFIHISYRGYIS